MNPLVLAAALLTVADGNCPDRPAAEKADLDLSDHMKLQGTWVLVAYDSQGDKRLLSPSAPDSTKITIQNDRYLGPAGAGTLWLEPYKEPRRITFVWIGDDETAWVFKFKRTRTQALLYDLNGDTLRLCRGSINECPTEFTSTGYTILTFKRDNKPEK